ncbi:uncharacterized protein TrAtP1_001097 [Trichoderma atroviride]|uniref:uncharacterized protein n=1 Tax=Hypocrea atroviridis TaxID=63577 RepID=UPI0033344FA5|nr:hypothetical protein TrAtP1_001097 [Trichoderma atroviride]
MTLCRKPDVFQCVITCTRILKSFIYAKSEGHMGHANGHFKHTISTIRSESRGKKSLIGHQLNMDGGHVVLLPAPRLSPATLMLRIHRQF